MKIDKFYEVRDLIEDFLRRDLIGAVFENEILDEFPSQYYCVGILYPRWENLSFDESSTAAPENLFRRTGGESSYSYIEDSLTDISEDSPVINTFPVVWTVPLSYYNNRLPVVTHVRQSYF